jgi:hypothetical protein
MATIRTVTRTLKKAHPNLQQVGRWLLVPPIGHTLVGLYLDGSGDKTIFRPTCVMTPLYLPGDSAGFGFGGRWRGRFEYEDPDIEQRLLVGFEEQVVPLLGYSSDLSGFEKWVLQRSGGVRHGIFHAYTAAALGEFEDAKVLLDTFFAQEVIRNVRHLLMPEYVKFRSLLESNPTGTGDVMRAQSQKMAQNSGVGTFWARTPFPFELAGKP